MQTEKKIVVTGGAGFIGSHLVDFLLRENFDVHIVDNLSSGKKENCNPKAVFHEENITNTEKLKEIFAGADTVFHLAAIPQVQYSIEHPLETNQNNITGTVSVFTAAKDAGVRRVIYSASSAAYGDQEADAMSEEMEARPLHPYGVQKYVGELYAKIFSSLYGLETVSLRYFNVYGPRQDPSGSYAGVIAKFLDCKTNGKSLPIIGDGTQTRDFVSVYDVAEANFQAMISDKVGKGEVINIGSGNASSVFDISEIFGGEKVFLPPRVEAKNSCANITLAKELLNWEPKESLIENITKLQNQ